eukprot:TRINITY_DN12125_c0_g2_i2.p1 TRINITY_DN12125_c0_g2~~TRINITY_DN12125_c0_g2_i2.p1  ORF type:complete len:188 (+),score=24.24 TRINITY_DN12125_c0_g2_i2:63-626(+)
MHEVALITSVVVQSGEFMVEDVDAPLLIAACAKVGIKLVPVCWDVTEDGHIQPSWTCNSFRFAVIRSVWNYNKETQKFRTWLNSVNCAIVNSTGIVADNIHKGYLKRMERSGVSIVPTEIVKQGSSIDVTKEMVFVMLPNCSSLTTLYSSGSRQIRLDHCCSQAGHLSRVKPLQTVSFHLTARQRWG